MWLNKDIVGYFIFCVIKWGILNFLFILIFVWLLRVFCFFFVIMLVVDRLDVVKYLIIGFYIVKIVCKVLSCEVMGLKRKYLDCKFIFWLNVFDILLV